MKKIQELFLRDIIIEKFEYWIINKRFYVETDNSQVIAFIKNKIPDTLANRRRARWSAFFFCL